MENNISLSIIVLVKNEEVNLEETLKNLITLKCNIYIVDSSSSDKTIAIAEKYTSYIYNYEASSFSDKLNWAIEHLPIDTKWTMRVDADESFTNDLRLELVTKLQHTDEDVCGITVKKRTYFLDKWMKYGGMYPIYTLRIWKTKQAYCEQRLLDEHIVIKKGKNIIFDGDIIDNDKKPMYSWIAKHNNYSTNEAITYFYEKDQEMDFSKKVFSSQTYRKRFLRNRVYYKTPLFIRPIIFFSYRYFFQLGFLDGKEGFVRHVLHSFWYRFLVDVKILEIKLNSKKVNKNPVSYINENYNSKF